MVERGITNDITDCGTRHVVSSMLVRSATAGGFIHANASFRDEVGFDETELVDEPFLHWIVPADVEVVKAAIEQRWGSCRVGHRTRNGDRLPLDIQVAEHDGETFIHARRAADAEVFEGPDDSADEATVSGTLYTIARIVEDQNPGFRCSILLVADGKFVRGAGPSLPEDYNAAIDGFAIGPTVGSCGTAIFWNAPVIVEDIQADPLWVPFAELAGKAGVAACWSHPFSSKNGNVLGALALYAPEPGLPTREQLGRLEAAARMTGLAVERGRAEEAFRAQRQRELELEEQLRQSAKMEALGVLAGGVAHDFNNILSTILANAEFGRRFLPEDSEVQDMLTEIVEASKRAGLFCQQMLAYAGRGARTISQIEIGTLVPKLSNLVTAAVTKKTTLEYELLDQPVHVEGDENQLLQVVMNLVTNAAEAIGENEGRITVSSDLVRYDENDLRQFESQDDMSPGEYVRLTVSDSGSGMAPETMTRIYDPFFTTKVSGRGLGLSAVKGIVSQHGGTIRVASVVGEGTITTVVLPTVAHTAGDEAEPASPAPEIGPKRILVADDERELLVTLSRILKHEGFDVLEAADGQEAVDLFIEHCDTIDCVLLDYSMPKLGGEEAQRALHGIRKDVPIVMMSGYGEQEVVDRFRENGIAGFLQKPVSYETLMETMRNTLADPS